MSGQSNYEPTSAFGKWFNDRLPIMGLVKGHALDFPTPKNLNYWYTFGGILAVMLVVQILTGVILEISRKAGETVPIMFTGAVFYRNIAEGDFFAYNVNDQCMALSMHLYTVTTQVNGAPLALPFAVATVLIASIILINTTAITVRAWLRARRKW